MNSPEEQYHELAFYTLNHPDPSFIHQYVIDAYTAQNADERSKPVSVIFALAGLYLQLEKNFTGKQVQQFHMKMAENKRAWPGIKLPGDRGSCTVADVLAAAPGPERDREIRVWCESVWESFKENRSVIIALVEEMNQK